MANILTMVQEQLYHDMLAVHEAMARGYVFLSKESLAAKGTVKSDGDKERSPLSADDAEPADQKPIEADVADDAS